MNNQRSCPVASTGARPRLALAVAVALVGLVQILSAKPARCETPPPVASSESFDDAFQRQQRAFDENFKRRVSDFNRQFGAGPTQPKPIASAGPASSTAAKTKTDAPPSLFEQAPTLDDPLRREQDTFDKNFQRSWDDFDRRFNRTSEQFDRTFNLVWTLVVVAVVGALGFWIWTILRKPRAVKHKPDLLGEQAERVANLLAAGRTPAPGVHAGYVKTQPIEISVEDRAVIIGPPGAGKTAFLVSQLLRWAESRRSFICLDIKPEIFGITRQRLDALGYRVLTFNPTAGTGQRYNPLADMETVEALREFATALIPGEEPKDAVFYESARDAFEALVLHLRATKGQASLVDIVKFLGEKANFEELLQPLFESSDAMVRDIANGLSMTASNNRLIGSILTLLRARLRVVRSPMVGEALGRSEFSLKALCEDRPVALFLQFEEPYRENTAHLLAAMVTHVLVFFIRHCDRPPVLLLLDEIGTAPMIPALPQKLNTIRSRGIPTCLYFQSREQMQKYGEKPDEGPNIILGAGDLHVLFRPNDNASAEWMSDRIGMIDRAVDADSVQVGKMAQRSQGLVTEPLIRPNELQALKTSEVVCSYRGMTWRGTARPYYELWLEYRGKRPESSQLRGAPYPSPPSPPSSPAPQVVNGGGVMNATETTKAEEGEAPCTAK